MTELATRRARRGFTLFEVLAAMVILAVGLLALEAMGIGAARMVVRADRQSAYTQAATDHLERVITTIEQTAANTVPNYPAIPTGPNGATITRTITRNVVGTRTEYVVTVNVTPPVGGTVNLQTVTVVGRVFR